jgi:polyisoprenoid-binding protein YceI
MQKTLFFLAALLLNSNTFFAQIYTAKAGATNITFFSSSPLEDITATNKGAVIVYKTTTNEIQIKVAIMNFKFKNALMEEHFNENYMETEKFPNATFKGKINEPIDLTKDGETKVTVTGKMEIHGVTKDETYNGTVTKKGNDIVIKTKFKIKLVDYNIKVPSLYVKNIAEIVDVDIESTLEPFQKK